MRSRDSQRRSARRFWLACFRDGELQPDAVRAVAAALAERPERGGSAVLAAFVERLRRHERQHRARVESAVTLDAATREAVRELLAGGSQQVRTVEFAENPALVAGLRVQVGYTVVDGSVRGRLERLRRVLQEE